VIAIHQKQRGLPPHHAQERTLLRIHRVHRGWREAPRCDEPFDAEVVAQRDMEVRVTGHHMLHGAQVERRIVHASGSLGVRVALHAEDERAPGRALGMPLGSRLGGKVDCPGLTMT
jgi:hypothetical protein